MYDFSRFLWIPVRSHTEYMYQTVSKKGKRKVQVVPQSQAAALPRHQNQTVANRTNARKTLRLALSSPSEVIAMLKGLEKHKNKITQGKT